MGSELKVGCAKASTYFLHFSTLRLRQDEKIVPPALRATCHFTWRHGGPKRVDLELVKPFRV